VGAINFIKLMFWDRNVDMKLWKYGIVSVALCMLICASFTASAINVSDPTGDVSYGNASDYYGEVDNRPNVDITQLSVIAKRNSVTLNLTVAGGIQISKDVMYTAYVNSTDIQYIMILNNDFIMGVSMDRSSGVREYSNGSVTVTGDTLSAVFNLRDNTSMVTIYGYTREGTLTQSGPTGVLWVDQAKYRFTKDSTDTDVNTTNNTSGNNTNDNSGTSPGKKTPGFELLSIITAVTITTILLRRRR
jgi:hypothetical protein